MSSLADALFGGRSRLTEQTGRTADVPSTSQIGRAPGDVVRDRALAHALGDMGTLSVDDFLATQGPMQKRQGQPSRQKGSLEEFEEIYAQQRQHQQENLHQQHQERLYSSFRGLPGEGDAIVEDACRGFLHERLSPEAIHGGVAAAKPMSVQEQCRVRDRSTILARQLFGERGDAYVNNHVDSLLKSLHIDQRTLPKEASGQEDWDGVWKKTTVAMDHAAGVGSQMHHTSATPQWADEFGASYAGAHASWADEFGQQQKTAGVDVDPAINSASAIEHTRRLAETLSAETDPKFKNSQFLQFVSKMSRGELIVDGN